jgi:hypothetical protein
VLPGFPPGAFENTAALSNVGAAPSYVGPGDVVASAYEWWGLRAYSAAYATATGRIANICTPADAVCADVLSDTNGNFNLAGTPSLTCNNVGSICTVKILYDQSGSTNCSGPVACDVSSNTIANRPILTINCIGSLPCMNFSTNSQVLIGVANQASSQAQPITISGIIERTANFTTQEVALSISGGTTQLYFPATTGQIAGYAGSVSVAAAANSVFHAVQWLASGASSILYIDGSSNSVNSGTLAINSGSTSSIAGSGGLNAGNIMELGIWASAFSAGNQSSMNTNQHTYWGF